MWDFVGQNKLRTIKTFYYRDAGLVLLVFSLNDR
jgi:GTPase SAR1 family protein